MSALLWFSLFFCSSLLRLPFHGCETLDGDPVQYTLWNCSDAGNGGMTPAFQANRDLLLHSLASKAPANDGYYNDTKGGGPDQVYGLALCRGDITATQCSECLAGFARNVSGLCPGANFAIARSPLCVLRFANDSFFGTPTGYDRHMYNWNNVSNPEIFKLRLGALVDELSTLAASSPRRFATRETDFVSSSSSQIYGMAQCTRDLSVADCQDCLQGEIYRIPYCCNERQGGVLLGWSCFLRYELYPFYGDVRATAGRAPSPPSSISNTGNASTPAAAAAPPDKKNINQIQVIVIVISSVVVVAIISIILIWLWRRRERKIPRGGAGQEIITSESLILFDLRTLKGATDNFSYSNKLGQGGFGAVYKGLLSDGRRIAVKRLSPGSWQGLEELRNEVLLVVQLQHRNLVKLFGYCLEENEMLLVYEYLQNGSLDRFLLDPNRTRELNWDGRLRIVEGIARGLLYLHEDSRLKVIHRDLKASNILLDDDLNPKISDFGLAKLFSRDQVQEDTSRIAGTYGYMAPEYVKHGQISTKSDVYSFGILALEIVTGRRSTAFRGTKHGGDLLSYVWKHWDEGNALQVLDQNIEQSYSEQEVLRCIHIGLLCVQDDPQIRPSMSAVVLMLSGRSVTLPVPSPLAYYSRGSITTSEVVM